MPFSFRSISLFPLQPHRFICQLFQFSNWLLRRQLVLLTQSTNMATMPTANKIPSTSPSVHDNERSALDTEVALVKISICQLTSTDDKAKNLVTLTNLIEAAAQTGSKIAFLPEGFDYIAIDKTASAKLAETLDGPFMTELKGLARTYDIWLSLGGFHEKLDTMRSDEFPWLGNTHVLVNNQGEIVSTYQKVHLFDISSDILGSLGSLKESDSIKPGSQIVKPISTPIGNVGLGICYDLRFPEFSASLRSLGATVLTFPSAFTVPTGLAHWEPLLRARAIENQCYVIASAQIGEHNPNRRSYGHSMIVDPWGNVVAEAADDQNLLTIDLDLNLVKLARKKMQVFNHRRNDLYVTSAFSVTVPDALFDEEIVPFGHIELQRKFIFMESHLSRAFVNKKCVLPGHVLVIPKRVVDRMRDLRPAEITDFFQLVQKVENIVEQAYGAKSSTVTAQDGPAAGQSVKHFHIHVIPRSPGDFEHNDTVYEKLGSHDKGEVEWRQEHEMLEEAKMLRHFVSLNFKSGLVDE